MLQKDLQKMGFPKNLAAVYLALFELGEGKAGEIIKKTGLHRNIVYGCLDKLEEKTLITKTELRGVAVYKTLHPDRILNELKDREQLAKNIVEELSTIRKPVTQEIIIHEGREEVQKQELESYKKMKSGETIRYLGISPHFSKVMGDNVVDELIEIQNKTKFFFQGISGYKEGFEESFVERTKGLTKFKVIPEITSRDTEMQIFDDRIVMKTFVEPYSVIEIINPAIAKSYRDYFDVLWKQEVRTYTGWEEIEHLLLQEMIHWGKKGDKEYGIGANYGMTETCKKKIYDIYLKYNILRATHGIHKYALFAEKDRDLIEQELKEATYPSNLYHLRFMKDKYWSPLQVTLIGGRAVVFVFSDAPVATVYERPEVVEGFQKQFEIQWELAKEG